MLFRHLISVSHNQLKQYLYRYPLFRLSTTTRCRVGHCSSITKIMTVQKKSMPSFASIVSVFSIVFYCAGFLRVELELYEQKKRINAVESVAEVKSSLNDVDMKIIKNAPGKCVLCNLSLSSVKIKEYNHQNHGLPNVKTVRG